MWLLEVQTLVGAIACLLIGVVNPGHDNDDAEQKQLREDARLLISNALHGEHFAPEVVAGIRSRLLDNAKRINQIIANEHIHTRNLVLISNLSIEKALEFTAQRDPGGSLKYARELQVVIDKHLGEYNAATEKEEYLKQLPEEERGLTVRLAEKRNLLKLLIKKLEKDRPSI